MGEKVGEAKELLGSPHSVAPNVCRGCGRSRRDKSRREGEQRGWVGKVHATGKQENTKWFEWIEMEMEGSQGVEDEVAGVEWGAGDWRALETGVWPQKSKSSRARVQG